MNAVDELLLEFGRQHRVAERLPPRGERSGELFQKMLDATFTAAQVIKKHIAHEAPTQARSPAQCGVRIGGAHDAFGDKIVNFSRKGGLQTIGHMAWHLLADSNRAPSDSLVEIRDALDRLLGGLGTTHDFDQRNEMWGIERMADYATLGMGAAACLNFAHCEPGRARRDDHFSRQQVIQLPIELLLEVEALGTIFLDEIRTAYRGLDLGRERQFGL